MGRGITLLAPVDCDKDLFCSGLPLVFSPNGGGEVRYQFLVTCGTPFRDGLVSPPPTRRLHSSKIKVLLKTSGQGGTPMNACPR